MYTNKTVQYTSHFTVDRDNSDNCSVASTNYYTSPAENSINIHNFVSTYSSQIFCQTPDVFCWTVITLNATKRFIHESHQ